MMIKMNASTTRYHSGKISDRRLCSQEAGVFPVAGSSLISLTSLHGVDSREGVWDSSRQSYVSDVMFLPPDDISRKSRQRGRGRKLE